MSDNLKIEVVVSDIPENGVMDFSIVTKQQLEIELAKIPKLKDGYMDITYIPTEITRQLNELSETIEQLSESLITDYQGIRRYCDSYIDSAVKDKADLINGSVPPNQLTGLFLRDNLWEGSNRFVYTIKGNIETANKLKNPVKINGIDFDGSKSIELSKSNIGLGNVDNTADKDKPISDAVKIVLDNKANAVDVYTKTEVDQKTDISLEGTLLPNTSAVWGEVPQIKKLNGDINIELNAQAKVLLQMLNDVRKNGGAMPFNQMFANAIGGFDVGDRVKLDTGEIVVSTIVDNKTNPNSNMLGWVNNANILSVNTIADLLLISAKNGMLVSVKSYLAPNFALASPFLGGDLFEFDDTKVSINDKGTIISGWVRKDTSDLFVEDFGARSDLVDNTSAIQDAFNSGHNISFRNGEVYKVSSSLQYSNVNSKIYGNSATIDFTYNSNSTNGDISCLMISNSFNITVESLNINIINSSLNKQYTAIKVSNSKNIFLDRLKLSNAGWSGLSIYDEIVNTSDRIFITNSNIEYCRFGIFSNGRGVVISKNFISNHWSLSDEAINQGALPIWTDTPTDSRWYDGIVIKGSDWIIENNIIHDNGQSGIYSGGCDFGKITNNTITNNWNKGIDLAGSRSNGVASVSNIDVLCNTCKDNKTGQIHLYKADFVKVIGNDALVINTDYSAVNNYTQPCILLNSDCFDNIISNNITIQNYATVVAIFINSASSKSLRNVLSKNTTIATLKYNVNFDDNYVEYVESGINKFYSDVQFKRRIKSVVNIDLKSAGLSGFDGRNALNLNASDDNTFVQVTSNLPINFYKPNGDKQKISVGELVSDSATLSGVTYFSDSASLRLPRTQQINQGYLWYDVASGNLKFTSTSGVVKTITAT